ncbi:DUF2569 family protein [Sphingomonas sp. ST-64]|uniref:DUF2569 family protein n=1 Tax=Sphingomonas plantiphila TaxID=3163295 RepID=A0ABW8YKA3_9SPHN
MAYRDGPSGIGGWLAFYIFTLAVSGPLVTIVVTYSNLFADPSVAAAYGDRWPLLSSAEIALTAVGVLSYYFIVWRLVARRNWHSVRLAIGAMWGLAIGFPLVDLLLVTTVGGLAVDSPFGLILPEMIRPFLYSALWTAYLLRSTRVANTYPRESDLDTDLAQVFE